MPISSFSNDRCGNFIFGHNVSERVTNASSSTTVNNDISEKHAPGESLELGTSISPEKEYTDASEVGEHCATLPSKQTLEESAAAVASEMLEKSTYLSANLQESPILTGEEGEYLSLKAYCHFYCFDRHKHEWAGRGQAYIHLNDVAMKSPCSQNQTSTPPSGPPARSRVVIRTCQTLKLLANVPVWSGLKVAMVDERSVRLTTVCHPSENLCDSQIKPSCLTDSIVTKPEFCAYLLVMHSQKEADRLFKALNSRIATFNSRQNAKLTDINETNSASSSPEDFSPLQSCEHIHLEDGDDSGFVNKIGREIVKTNAKSGINELSTSGDREVSLLTSTTDSS
ncbi:unnamed protein product [Heterobilharzia americana]|nr:unnamed protein product [Heterobilharzia americana]